MAARQLAFVASALVLQTWAEGVINLCPRTWVKNHAYLIPHYTMTQDFQHLEQPIDHGTEPWLTVMSWPAEGRIGRDAESTDAPSVTPTPVTPANRPTLLTAWQWSTAQEIGVSRSDRRELQVIDSNRQEPPNQH